MKKYFLFATILFCLAANRKLNAQCLKDSIFNTDSLGIINDKLPFLLTFKISLDSIHIYSTRNTKYEFLAFALVEKQECKWNIDFTEGYSSFLMRLTEKNGLFSYPKLKIIYEKQNGRRIEVLYPNSEERVFTIMQ